MLVKVKNVAVFHEGERYEVGKELEIKKEDHNDSLFSIVKKESAIDQTDVSKLKKEELQILLDEKGIEYEAAATKNDLLALLEANK